MLHFMRKSVLRRYLVTYIGLAIAASAVLGAILLSTSVSQLRSTTDNTLRQRLSVASADFIYQLKTMEDIALQVQTTAIYHPNYIARNPYYLTELLDHFARFSGYSPLISHYYLYYPDLDTIFGPTSQYTMHLFAQYALDGASAETVRNTILHADVWMTLDACPDAIFRVFPLRYHTASGETSAYLLFAIQRNDLPTRYATLFGISGELNISYGDVALLGHAHVAAPLAVYLPYARGEIRFAVVPPPEQIRSPISGYRGVMLAAIIVCTLAFALLAAGCAYGNYLPIRRLMRKLNVEKNENTNEMTLIERVIDEMQMEKHGSIARLTQNLAQIGRLTTTLKQQILLRILDGEYSPQLEQRMVDVGMNFHRPLCCALYIPYDKQIDSDAICRAIDAASDESVLLYAAPLAGTHGWAVVLCADSMDDLLAVNDVLPELLLEKGIQVTPRMGAPCKHPEQLARSFAQAESGIAYAQTDPPLLAANWYDTTQIMLLKEALKEGSFAHACACLSAIFMDLSANCASRMFMRYLLVDLTYQIVSTGKDLQCTLSDQEVQSTVLSTDIASFQVTLEQLLQKICQQVSPPQTALPEMMHTVLHYIEAHAQTYTICLDSVADACEISTKQVNRIVKGIVNMTFKEYIVHLRMQEAMRLLRAGVSATDTAKQVGYLDVSHFIKTFRAHHGCTPGQFRAKCEIFLPHETH